MALKGTLKDFGIADIFQLIGHQSKTGVLILKNNEQEVRITFKEGNVVKADSTTRERRELLGAMLVRSEVITQTQLDQALDLQKRTLKRLGDLLVDAGFLPLEVLREFTKLQTTETIYKLFLWSAGTYEFTQAEGEMETDGAEPIRSESVLMEGFRMVDEWPLIRQKVQSYGMTFRVLRAPPALQRPATPAAGGNKDFLDGIDDAFGAMEAGDAAPPPEDDEKVGPNERLVFGLVQPGRDVQKVIDLSRLGEFETCKSLHNLITGGYLEGIPAAAKAGSGLAEGGALEPRSMRQGRTGRVQEFVGYALGAVAAVLLLWGLDVSPRSLTRSDRLHGVPPEAVKLALGEASLERVQHALEVFRLRTGGYPDNLDALVEAGLLNAREIRLPFDRPFAYVKQGKGYQLVRPYF